MVWKRLRGAAAGGRPEPGSSSAAAILRGRGGLGPWPAVPAPDPLPPALETAEPRGPPLTPHPQAVSGAWGWGVRCRDPCPGARRALSSRGPDRCAAWAGRPQSLEGGAALLGALGGRGGARLTPAPGLRPGFTGEGAPRSEGTGLREVGIYGFGFQKTSNLPLLCTKSTPMWSAS